MTQIEKPILHLNLTKKWYGLIEAGIKPEEYRKISPYWQRVFSAYIKIKGKFYHPTDVIICFSNGYKTNRPQMKFECLGMHVGYGRWQWGAEPDEQYYVIKIGKRLDTYIALN